MLQGRYLSNILSLQGFKELCFESVQVDKRNNHEDYYETFEELVRKSEKRQDDTIGCVKAYEMPCCKGAGLCKVEKLLSKRQFCSVFF